MDRAQLDQAVAEWLRLDRNETTRVEIQILHDQQDYDALRARFSTRIAFGTAGLRAKMQAGTSSMNDLIVLQATQGLARYALDNVEDAQSRGVVLGYDHRAVQGMNSKRFAQLAANVFRREGYKVYAFEGLVHTPMVPFATSRLNAALGLMVTASHNPAADNGYKVYWANAVQIIPPHDSGIAARIDESLEVDEDAWNITEDQDSWHGSEEMKREYLKMAGSLAQHAEDNTSTDLVFTYTAMHGVGKPFAQAAFAAAGFPESALRLVPEQAEPDSKFSTVKFPNPEEKGALDLAIARAEVEGSSIVLANDPDADRFCAAEKVPSGKWNVFTGDQLGTLLGWWTFDKYRQSHEDVSKLAMCASTVSSKMLRAMAEKEGFRFKETLTGFKYLGNAVLDLADQGYHPLFAFEEAIGYLQGEEIRDKDGVTALVCFCEMAATLQKQGKTLSDQLDALYERYGFFTTSNSYFICRDSAKTDRIFSQLRFGTDAPSLTSIPSKLPSTLGGLPITYMRDLTVGYDSSNPPTFAPDLPIDPKSHMISFACSAGDDVAVTGTVRTSGTEPKIKFYLEGSGHDRQAVQAQLARVREALGNEWLKWEENGLERA